MTPRYRFRHPGVARLVGVAVILLGLVACAGASSSSSLPDSENAGGAVDNDASLLRYDRTGGFDRNDTRSLSITRGGAFDLRLSTGGARVGRFSGTLETAGLRSLLRAIAELPGPYQTAGQAASESTVEHIDAEGVTATITSGDDPPKPWSNVLRIVREQSSALTESPRAALELLVETRGSNGSLRGELRQVGTDPVRLTGGSAIVEVSILGQSGEVRSTWSTTIAVAAVEAEPGWALDLGLQEADPSPRPLDRYVVSVELLVIDADAVSHPARLAVYHG